jgi:hypothetical protein
MDLRNVGILQHYTESQPRISGRQDGRPPAWRSIPGGAGYEMKPAAWHSAGPRTVQDAGLTKHHAVKTYGWAEVQLHALLTSALDGGEWSASCHGSQYPYHRRLGGPQSGSGRGGEDEKIPPGAPEGNRTPLPSHFSDWATPAALYHSRLAFPRQISHSCCLEFRMRNEDFPQTLLTCL